MIKLLGRIVFVHIPPGPSYERLDAYCSITIRYAVVSLAAYTVAFAALILGLVLA